MFTSIVSGTPGQTRAPDFAHPSDAGLAFPLQHTLLLKVVVNTVNKHRVYSLLVRSGLKIL